MSSRFLLNNAMNKFFQTPTEPTELEKVIVDGTNVVNKAIEDSKDIDLKSYEATLKNAIVDEFKKEISDNYTILAIQDAITSSRYGR